ncbi:MAG: dihydroorotate dehydrogenase [Pycnora praestabilis]|nr:MAG: dihydroorotate dehydrogenase [Pycnora praestabilis]
MPLNIDPPLLNSANPWASTKEDLSRLYDCPSTGAVTTRTCLLNGFYHDAKVHQYIFFDGGLGCSTGSRGEDVTHVNQIPKDKASSLNTLGYSPYALSQYLVWVKEIAQKARKQIKPFILSVTGSPEDVVKCYHEISDWAGIYDLRLLMEINLSCPNIPGKPPPAYDDKAMYAHLDALGASAAERSILKKNRIEIGIKTPPYTYQGQFDILMGTLRDFQGTCPISFITATNTLGGCLLLDSNMDNQPALASTNVSGIGGLAGAALHQLALGNVKTLRMMLDQSPKLKHIEIIGVGGVADAAGYNRMLIVGASVVAVGTALGVGGVEVFGKILGDATRPKGPRCAL